MISIIICSANSHLLNQVTRNITYTIGINHEIISFDNKTHNLGICHVYNKLAAQARFEYLLFLHEDILFETENWGNVIVKLFQSNEKCGLIGVAGSSYKSKMYSGWYTGINDFDVCNITHLENEHRKPLILHRSPTASIYQTICVDGVFIACRKSIWEKTKFNEGLLKGFHYYDLDFSIRASSYCEVLVTMEIDLVHITKGGDYGNKWVKETFIFHEEMKNFLPSYHPSLRQKNYELKTANVWLDRLKNERISFKNRIKWIIKQKLLSYPSLYYGIIKFLLYHPLKLKGIHNAIKRFSAGNQNSII